MPISTARQALAQAITNDRRGVVSERDAKSIVDAAVREIAAADQPEAVFEHNKRFIAAASQVVGADADVPGVLAGYQERGLSAVNARLVQLGHGQKLPPAVEKEFQSLVRWGGIEGGTEATISNVQGSSSAGYSFDYRVGDKTGTAHAIRYDGGFVLSPKPVSAQTLDAATSIMRRYFDAHWEPHLRDDWGVSAAEIASMRAAIRPSQVFFPAESDPIGLTDTYPVVLSMENPTGSDHGFYVGIDPATGDGDAGDFN